MSAILNRSPALCRCYVACGLIFSGFLLSYIIWKIVLGSKILEEKQPDLNLNELRAFYVINFVLVLVTWASSYCMFRVAPTIADRQESDLTVPNHTTNSLDCYEVVEESHETMLPFLAL